MNVSISNWLLMSKYLPMLNRSENDHVTCKMVFSLVDDVLEVDFDVVVVVTRKT